MVRKGLTIIIPTYYAASTIQATLHSIFSQNRKVLGNLEIIVIDDQSTDGTPEIAKKTLSKFKRECEEEFSYKVVKKPVRTGHSDSYNMGLKLAKNEIVALIQQDILFSGIESLSMLFRHLRRSRLVATFPYIIHTREIWNKYNLWQKVQFDRHLEKSESGNFTKCIFVKKDAVLEVGGYDVDVIAGEDRDLYERLKVKGKIDITNTMIIHVHSLDPKYNLRSYLSKEAQYGEASGILLRRYKLSGGVPPEDNFISNSTVLLRPLLLLIGLIPVFGWLLLMSYAYLYARNTIAVFPMSVTLTKVIPAVIIGTFLYTIYMVKGYVLNKSSMNYL